MPFTRHITPARNALKAALLLLALLLPAWQLAAAPAAPAAPATPPTPKKELTEKVSAAVQEIGAKLTEGNYDAALAIINPLLPTVIPESYDTAYLSQMKAQALIGKAQASGNAQDYIASTAPLETVLTLSEKYGFFPERSNAEILWMLAQLYVQDANNEKNPAYQQQKYTKALNTLRRWLSRTTKPNYEAHFYIASILYQQAMMNKDKPDKELLKQSEEAALNAMSMVVKPKDDVYKLLVAIAQLTGDQVKSAKYLEVMVMNNPKNNQYWGMLLNSYIQAIEATPEGSFLRDQAYAMAVYTITRAQQNGFMLTPDYYYTKVALYVQSGQHQGAADLLQASLRNGKMETSKYSHWELLANLFFQSLEEPQKAIETFREAQKVPSFANDGNIDMQIGMLYFGQQKYAPALEAFLSATKKEVPDKKAVSLWAYIGYVYLYLKEYEKGMEAVGKALTLDPKDNNAQGIKRALGEAIDERTRMLNLGQAVKKAQQEQQQEQQARKTQPAQ